LDSAAQGYSYMHPGISAPAFSSPPAPSGAGRGAGSSKSKGAGSSGSEGRGGEGEKKGRGGSGSRSSKPRAPKRKPKPKKPSVGVPLQSPLAADPDVAKTLAARRLETTMPEDHRLGRRIHVLWPEDNTFYPAKVVGVEAGGGLQAQLLISYEEGGTFVEWVNPMTDRFYLEPKQPNWARHCAQALDHVMKHQKAGPFLAPVDPVKLSLPDYHEVVSEPMDLGTVRRNLQLGRLKSMSDFVRDVHLTFDNAKAYNVNKSHVFKWANELRNRFNKEMDHMRAAMRTQEAEVEYESVLVKASKEVEAEAVKEDVPIGEIRIETPMTIDSIRSNMAISTDARKFNPPIGWSFTVNDGYEKRSTNPLNPGPRFGKDRVVVEKFLEGDVDITGRPKEKFDTDIPWLGQVVNGVWEIRERYVVHALRWVLEGLELSGHVARVPSKQASGSKALWMVSNKYQLGEAPAKKKGHRPAPSRKVNSWEAMAEDENSLSEFERHRLENMRRNNAFLAELGLA